ncbi:hypothetical protein JGU71_03040 [Antrihabitans sp. YC3-6]|uniref:AttH domain-containing protein n=1 Tax=Antrihabitans stalagmiti TaxID=2799499 RepID=A0A934NMH6_9NOCA|nr:hypothetical protein [Antrihabitans stalagmiti]MBJ8337852.1 hypothetical protein [Antrihabitans stalagmiti]
MPSTSLRLVVVVASVLVFLANAAAAPAAPFPPATPNLSNDLTVNPSAKIAEPSDDVAHPGVWTEWWYVHLMDPASMRQIVVAIFNAPVPMVGGVFMYPDGAEPISLANGLPSFSFPHTGAVLDGLPGVRTNLGALNFDVAAGAYHLALTAPFDIDVWLDGNPLPGATGRIDLKNAGEWMGWTSPVATSTARGSFGLPGAGRVDVTGWRGYHDHNWGNFTMIDQAADGWEWAVSHEPDGGAALLGGLVRRGGEWTGSITDVRPSGTRVCSSSILEVSEWTDRPDFLHGSTFSVPGKVTATCGPNEPHQFSKTFYVTDPIVADAGILALTLEAPYHTVPGSFGMLEHVRSLLARIEQSQR